MLQRQGCFHGGRGGMDGGPAVVQFSHKLHHPLGEGRLQPDQFRVAPAQSGRVDPHDVPEAAHRKVEPLAGTGWHGGAVRGLCTVHKGQFFKGLQDSFDGGQRGAVDDFLESRGRGTVGRVRIRAEVEGLQYLHLRPVQPLQGPLDADPRAGPGRQGRKVRNVW
ncbi:hypothetical protein FQZ97_1071420 [compost metagenome]